MFRLALLLSAAILLTSADIPVTGNTGVLICISQATVAQLKCGNTVANVLQATGLSLLDFILLQDQNMGYIFPNTQLQQDQTFCIAGRYW